VLTEGARKRRTARRVMLALVVCCVLTGTIPAAVELSRQGLDSWTSTEPFLEHRDNDSP
jgi:hypothetical protein